MSQASVPPRVFRGNLASWQPPTFGHSQSTSRPAEIVQWEHGTLFPKHPLTADIALVESYGSIKLLDYEAFFSVARSRGPRQPDRTRLPQPTALRLAGTEFLILPDRHQPEFAARASELRADRPESATLWRMKETLPRAWIVHDVDVMRPLPRQQRLADVHRRTMEVLFPNDTPRDFFRTAVVETDAPLEEWLKPKHVGALQHEQDACLIAQNDSQRVRVQVTLAEPGLLVLSDACYPGWRAFSVIGAERRELTIYRTDRVFRGVWLPAGDHTVEFRFQPRSFYHGALISGLSWAIAAFAAVATAWRRHRNGA